MHLIPPAPSERVNQQPSAWQTKRKMHTSSSCTVTKTIFISIVENTIYNSECFFFLMFLACKMKNFL